MQIKPYEKKDLEQILQLFYNTVHTINRRDYSEIEVNAWASKTMNQKNWHESFLNHVSLVAIINHQIVGFGDIHPDGYLDRLYVHHLYQNQGIATQLVNQLEQAYPVSTITVHASITAKPFFEHRGYQVISKQQVERHGILLTNYIMHKQISIPVV